MRWWIGLSVVLNTILLWRCWDTRARATASLEPVKPPATLFAAATNGALQLSNPVQFAVSALGSNESSFQWADVESDDLPEFRDRLRAKGCPETLVRDLVERPAGATQQDAPGDASNAETVVHGRHPAHHDPEPRRTIPSNLLPTDVISRTAPVQPSPKAARLLPSSGERDPTNTPRMALASASIG